jgi:rod shape-determining protein MreD
VRALISLVVVAVTVVFQLTVVDRIAFPGGSGPDLVLLAVVALALASGPMAGTLTGFLAGLALDVAPPGSHFVGEDALVFCLIGYACGLLADDSSGDGGTELGHTALFEIVVTAAGAICGEALVALLGVMLSDPRVTWPAITRVLPVAVAYDVLLCPFVLYAVAAALRLAGPRDESQRVGWSPARATPQVPGGGLGAIRQIGGSTPRLRLAERGKGQGSLGGMRGQGAGGRPTGKREPQLRLARSGSTTAYTSTGSRGLGGGQAKVRFGSRRHEGVLGGSMLGGARSGSSALRATSSMGRSWLGGSVFSRSSSSLGLSSPLGRSSVFGRPASLGLSSPVRHRGNTMRSSAGLGGRRPRFAKSSKSSKLTAALHRPARQKSPGNGWLGGRSASLSRGWTAGRSKRRRSTALGSGRSGRSGPARLHMPRQKTKRRWRTGGYR